MELSSVTYLGIAPKLHDDVVRVCVQMLRDGSEVENRSFKRETQRHVHGHFTGNLQLLVFHHLSAA